MGGSSVNPYEYISRPDPSLSMALVGQESNLGKQQLAAQNALLKSATGIPLQPYTPDIYGPQGALNQASQVAAINAFKSKQLEQQQNPAAAVARQNIQTAAAQGTDPNYWQNQMAAWGKSSGVQ